MKLEDMWKNKDNTEWYLEPENENEAAILVKLIELFPEYFEMFTSKSCISYRYEARLKVKKFNLAEHIPPNMTITIKDDIVFGTYHDPTVEDTEDISISTRFDTTDFKLGKDKDIVSDLLDKVENNLKCSACGSDDLKILYTEKPHVPKTIFIDHYSCESCSAEQQVRRDS